MPIDLRSFRFSNFARSTLAEAISAAVTEIELTDASLFPSPALPGAFDIENERIVPLVVTEDGETEIMYCTAAAGNTLTVERGAEGSTARAFSAGADVVNTVVAGFLEQQRDVTALASAVVLETDGIDVDGTSLILVWSASTPGANDELLAYDIYRADGTYDAEYITSVEPDVLTFTDTTVDVSDGDDHEWYVVPRTRVRGDGTASNTVNGLVPVAFILQNGTQVARSTDLDTWTNVTITANPGRPWTGGAYAPSLGRVLLCSTSVDGAYSDDGGVTWNLMNFPVGNVSDIAWSSSLGLFCIVAAPAVGVTQIWTSPTGLTGSWTLNNSGARANTNYTGIAWHDTHGLFCAVGDVSGNNAVTSPDGVNWTQRAIADGGWGFFSEIRVAGPYLLAFSEGSNTVVRSADGGVSWTGGSGPLGAAHGYGSNADASRYVRIRTGSAAVEHSTTYDSGYTLVSQGSIYLVLGWSDDFEKFVIADDTPSSQVRTSSDGITWTPATTFTLVNIQNKMVFSKYIP